MALPRTVNGVFKRIADDIEKFGHYTDKKSEKQPSKVYLWNAGQTERTGVGQCCLMVNPTLFSLIDGTDAQRELAREAQDAMRELFAPGINPHRVSLAGISNNTPTSTLLERLRGKK